MRDRVRSDQESAADESVWLLGLIQEGLTSGVLDAKPADVIEEIIAERRARHS